MRAPICNSAFLATATTIVLLTTSAGAQHHTIRFFTSSGSPIAAHCLVFSPDSQTVAVSTKDGKSSLVDTGSGELQYQHELAPFTMNYSADGSRLFMLASRATQLLNIADRQVSRVTWQVPKGFLGFALETRNGKLLVKSMTPGGPAAESGDIQVGDELVAISSEGKDRNLLGQSVENALAALGGPIGTPITLRVIHSGEVAESRITLRRQRSRQVKGQLTFDAPTGAASAPRTCIGFVNGSFIVLDAASGDVLSALTPVDVQAAGQNDVSPDGRYFGLVAGGRENSREMAVEIFDIARQERVLHVSLPERSFIDAAFSPDGKQFLVGSQDRLQVLDLDEGRFVEPFFFSWRPAPPRAVARREEPAGGTPAAAAAAAVADEVGPVLGRSRTRAPRQLLSCFAVSPAGTVAVGSPTGTVELWSLKEGTLIDQPLKAGGPRDQHAVECIAFSPSGDWLAFYGGGTLHVLKVP